TGIYALGAVLYQLLTDKIPYRGLNPGEVRAKVLAGPPPDPSKVNPGVPKALERICLKAMARQIKDRYASALELAGDVERWLADEPVSAWPDPLWVRLGRWARRHRLLVTGGIALLTTVVVALAIGLVIVNAEKSRTLAAKLETEQERDKARAARNRLR